MGFEQDGFRPEQVHAPETVLGKFMEGVVPVAQEDAERGVGAPSSISLDDLNLSRRHELPTRDRWSGIRECGVQDRSE